MTAPDPAGSFLLPEQHVSKQPRSLISVETPTSANTFLQGGSSAAVAVQRLRAGGCAGANDDASQPAESETDARLSVAAVLERIAFALAIWAPLMPMQELTHVTDFKSTTARIMGFYRGNGLLAATALGAGVVGGVEVLRRAVPASRKQALEVLNSKSLGARAISLLTFVRSEA
ncbi:hypothetical protein JKP88DRAFT_273975 [Tribonema minus]|uniref:Uncharacterized protein n=1 Tax=Tribonema minus TaxID=303371 RepID=A0A835YLG9_9STRA|nr:hypothetical protein JKP88DRAFT_273975 [Tribonema minus]